MKIITYLVLSAVVLSSCGSQSPVPNELNQGSSNSEYIIFGHFYGFCGGEECIEIFKVTNDALFEDTNDFYPNSDNVYDAEFAQLDQSKFNKLKNLNFVIPDRLFDETKIIIGAPDAADGGGIYLQLSDGRYWLLDMSLTYLPEYLHPLREQIRLTIEKINE
ncbi:hypothetical protein [Reichenbachiella sp.]|uniref:hypothetical protein n=1 Tax=Reichenbachiella sp. TaxID=2184521 RepID=UPI003296AFE1